MEGTSFSFLAIMECPFLFLFLFIAQVVSHCFATPQSLPGSSVHGISQARILPFPSPEDLPDLGIEPVSLAWQTYSLLLSHLESPFSYHHGNQRLNEERVICQIFLCEPLLLSREGMDLSLLESLRVEKSRLSLFTLVLIAVC